MNNIFLSSIADSMGLDSSTKMMLWIGIAVYMGILLLIGLYSGKKVNSMKDFLVAGRRLPLWMATATLLATWFGAGSSMGVSATVYSDGIKGVLADPFGASLSLMLAGVFMVGLLRKKKYLTVTDIISERFGRGAGIYASFWMIPVYVGWIAAQLLGMGTILHVITGISVFKGTLIGAVVVLIYTVSGGMWAVTLTDVVQVSLLAIGLVIIMPFAIAEAGGFDNIIASLNPSDLSIGPGKVTCVNDVTYYIGNWIIMGLGCMVGQDLIQRSLSSRSAKVAVSSSVISGFLYLLIGMIPIVIGFSARIIFAKYNITAETMGGDLENQVMPRIAIMVLGSIHPFIMTVFLAALVSAIMSSADSSLLAGSSLLVRNVVGNLFPVEDPKIMLRRTRIATIVLLVIATVLAFTSKSIYALMVNCWTSQLVVVFLPVIIALYVPKASRSTVWAVMFVSTAVWLFYTFICVCGSNSSFAELLQSDVFERAQTCGAVYGFGSGIVCFILCHFGERFTKRFAGNDNDIEE